MPIVKTAQAIKTVASGELIEVLATDPGSTKDMAAWARTTGNELVEQSVDGAVFRFVLRRK
jgi:tRNA 2-thiouridine synthesizing protein A